MPMDNIAVDQCNSPLNGSHLRGIAQTYCYLSICRTASVPSSPSALVTERCFRCISPMAEKKHDSFRFLYYDHMHIHVWEDYHYCYDHRYPLSES